MLDRDSAFAITGRNVLSINQVNWRAGHCEFVIYPMVELTWIEIYEMNHILNCGCNMKMNMVFAVEWTT